MSDLNLFGFNMKKPITLVLFFICGGAHSEDLSCNNNFNVAESIMEHRQAGDSIADQYKVLNFIRKEAKGKQGYDSHLRTYEDMILKAYEIPKYSSEDYKKEAINDFANNWFLICKRLEIK